VYRLVRALLDGERPPTSALQELNECARRPALAPQIGAMLERQWSGGIEAALSVLAREAVELLATSDRELIRECAAAPECSRIYLDRSPGRRRRWCHMGWCGSNAKMRAYRRRRAAVAS
jgi:predicted RNA-binding Zn ribbon-like protein